MRKQTQFNGLWQSTTTGVIRYADTEHGVLWERTLEETREVWRQLPVSKSHVRGYLQAQSEAGWQMVSANRDAAREPEAFAAWHGDMFPHGVPLRVSEYACDVYHAAMSACESDAAAGWTVDMRGAVHALTPEEREMIRLTMAMDAMDDSWETDVMEPEPAMESAETVVVEPVEVEHDGVVDVELAETSETTPVVEAETAEAETAEYRAVLYRTTCDSTGNDYTLVVDGSDLSVHDAASFVADYVRNNIRPNFRNVGMESAFRVTTDARVRVTAKICGVGGVRAEVEYYRRDAEVSYRCFSVWAESADYFGKAIRDRGVTDAWDKTVSFARGIEVALKRDKLIHKHDGNECAALIETYDEAIGYKDASKYDARVVSLPVGGFIEPCASDKPSEVETAEAEPDGYGQYVGMWTRGNERVCVCADGTVWAHFDHPDDAYESWVRQETLYGVGAFVCETFADRGWVHVSCEADGDVPRYVTDRGAAVPGTVCADDAANGWRYDGLSAVIRDYADVPTPRAVESEPVLPAECNAVTQEIPEVPPQTNEDARVLQVSEHVIPTGQKVAGGAMFPDVSYRSVHAFTVAVLDDVGNVVKRKKVAYAFRHNGMVHVVRRDRYEQAGRDATVEAEIAEFVAKLRKAA